MADDRQSPSPPRKRSAPARLLAPLALVATIVALILVVSTSGDTEQPADQGQGSGAQSTNTGGGGKKKEETPKTYLVEPGDSLGTIAERFQISVDRLLRLNDKVDPNALVTGQELKLQK
ncbi:MAG: LysM domain-containing protein [Solirubrobacterales bacterium]